MDNLELQIRTRLEEFWDERSIALGGEPHDVSELGAAMDSLTAIEVLVDIADLVGNEVPADKTIKKGGYQNRDEFVGEITTKVITFLGES